MSTKLQDNIRALLDLSAPAPGSEPPPKVVVRPVYHSDECSCESCCSVRDAITNYINAKRLYEINGF
jgi:hypothetical protein